MKNKKQDGFVKEVILIVVALIAIKYFWHFDVIGYLEVPVEKGLAWAVSKFK